MEMNVKVDFQDGYSSLQQPSTPVTLNVSQALYPGYSLGEQAHVSCNGNGTDEYETFYRTAQFVTGLVLYPIFCITGILGNSLSLIVLSHKDMATSTNVYLLALGISDSLKLLNDFLYSVMLVISLHNPTASEAMMVNVYPYAHYVFQVAVCVTAWLTVAVSMDRYVSVCYPSRSKAICTIPRARTVVTTVFIIMMLLSIPSVFRYRLQTIHDSTTNQTCMELVVTELGRNQHFMIPYTWVQNFLRGIIPVFVLIFLNARIIKALWKERVKGKKFNSRNRITLMLIAMVVIFIVCITPDAIMSTFFGKGYVEEDYLVKGIREITDALVAFNSAVNFLLYCSLSAVFRNTFTRVFFGRRYAKMDRFGSHRNVSRDGTSGGTSLKRRISHKDGKVKNGRRKDKGSGNGDEEEEIEDLMKNGGETSPFTPDDAVVTACENGNCLNISCHHHVCLDLKTRSTSPGNGSAEYSSDTRGHGSEEISHSSSSAGAASSSTSSTGPNKKRKTPNFLCDIAKVNGAKDRNKKSSRDKGNFGKSRSKEKGSAKNAQKNGDREMLTKKPATNMDMSYLTSAVYLGPTTEILPFELSRRDTSANPQTVP